MKKCEIPPSYQYPLFRYNLINQTEGGVSLTHKTWLLILLCCYILYITLHATPSLAIRTKLFFTGQPVSALTSKISLEAIANKGYQPYLNDHHAKTYRISHPPSPELNDFIVYLIGFTYSAKYLEYDIVNIMNV